MIGHSAVPAKEGTLTTGTDFPLPARQAAGALTTSGGGSVGVAGSLQCLLKHLFDVPVSVHRVSSAGVNTDTRLSVMIALCA